MNTTRRDAYVSTGLLVLRVAIGLVFIFHGAQKLFGVWGGPGLGGFGGWLASMNIPMPAVSALLAAGAEFFGGLAVLLGVYARLAVLPMIFTMLVAIGVNMSKGFSVMNGGIEFPLVMGLILVAVGLTGSGQFSLDRLWCGARVSNPPLPATSNG